MTSSQQTIWNRTAMHSGVRSATELLQQEVGQAGRVTLPGVVPLSANVAAGTQTATVTSVAGIFQNELLTVGTGDSEEPVTAVNAALNRFTATFSLSHAAGAPVRALGGFATGVVPTTHADGSTADRLKLYGDINGDGQMVFVEYTCDTDAGHLYRNSMPFDAAVKPGLMNAHILLSNVQPNPAREACFTYEEKVVNGVTFVIDVAITLTVQTQQRDPVHEPVPDRNEGVAERRAAQRLQRVGTGEHELEQPDPADAGHDRRPSALAPTP
jgi:hypothetical protein